MALFDQVQTGDAAAFDVVAGHTIGLAARCAAVKHHHRDARLHTFTREPGRERRLGEHDTVKLIGHELGERVIEIASRSLTLSKKQHDVKAVTL